MADEVRLVIDGYAVLELNKCAFQKDGRLITQLPLGSDFSSSVPAENGMLLGADYAKGKVVLPTGAATEIIGLHYSTEKLYNQQNQRLKDFALFPDTSATIEDANYPRLGILAVGDTFTTNCISYDPDEASLADEATVKITAAAAATTALYGIPTADGTIQLTAIAPTTGVGLQVVKATTLPNGDYGIKFVVILAQ